MLMSHDPSMGQRRLVLVQAHRAVSQVLNYVKVQSRGILWLWDP